MMLGLARLIVEVEVKVARNTSAVQGDLYDNWLGVCSWVAYIQVLV